MPGIEFSAHAGLTNLSTRFQLLQCLRIREMGVLVTRIEVLMTVCEA